MRLHILCSIFIAAIVNAQLDDKDKRLAAIFGNSSEFIPPGYEAVTKAPLGALEALPRCGEGADKGKKVCIVYHRCDPETGTVTPEEINTTGEGIFDIRENVNPCENYLDVCCKLPEGGELPTTTTTTIKPIDPVAPLPKPAPSYCGIRNERGLDFKITGNTNEAEYGEFPWMLAILKANYNPAIDKTPFVCGASLIAPSVVLTGAHCIYNYEKKLGEIKIRAGEWDAVSEKERLPYQERSVKRVVIHKEYDPKSLVNDIALLILEIPFSQAENIGTLCLPENDQAFDTARCLGSGWGKKAFADKTAYSAILKKLDLPMVPADKCQDSLRNTRLGVHFILDQSFVCAGGQAGVDTCTGDGGSPLICPDPSNAKRYVQVGMVAWGIGCGDAGVPGVYVNVPRYRNWIDEKMIELGLSIKPYTI